MIFEMCRLDARGPSITEYYHEPFWATVLEVWFVSEVARLKANRDPKVMEGYLSRRQQQQVAAGMEEEEEEEKTLTTLKVDDYIKEAIWQRSANLEHFNAIVLAHLD